MRSDSGVALGFLSLLQSRIAAEADVCARVDAEVEVWKNNPTPQHKLACRENIWLYFIVLPIVFRTAVEFFSLSRSEACDALGGEYYKKFPEYLSHNSFCKVGHVLPKKNASADSIYEMWTKQAGLVPQYQTFPDLTLADPAPVKIVFEAKYFVKGNAIKELVDGIRQTVFYRGLPRDEEGGSLYDFGCFLAYDASPDGSLATRWNDVNDKAHFWQTSNIFPIILREGARCQS